MFWKYNSLSSSQIDTLLDRANAAKEAAALKKAAAAAAAAEAEAAGSPAEGGGGSPVKEDAEAAAKSEDDPAADPAASGENGDGGEAEAEASDDLLPDSLKPVTLRDILDQEDVIQECKNQNKKLVDYLCQGEILSELISLIVEEPPPELEEEQRFKLPHVAAEVLSCEVAQINEALSSDERLLGQLYSFMELPPPLNPLLASFFSKAFGVLITRKSEQNWYNYQYSCVQVLEFLKKRGRLVPDLLRHVGTSAISDLLVRLINCVEGNDIKQDLLDWLNENRLIESMIGLLDPSLPRDIHDNASRLLIEVLRMSRDGQFAPANERCEDPLLATLEDPKTIELLLSVIFTKAEREQRPAGEEEEGGEGCEYCESSLVNGISVLMALLECRKPLNLGPAVNAAAAAAAAASIGGLGASAANMFGSGSAAEAAAANGANLGGGDDSSPEEVEKQQRLLDLTIGAILPRVADFTRLLLRPPDKGILRSSAGALDPPLGITRLSVAKLIVALLSTNNLDLNRKLKEENTLDALLDLFFKYSLNNFLHSQVEQCVQLVFEWRPPPPKPVSTSEPSSSSAAASSSVQQGDNAAAAADAADGAAGAAAASGSEAASSSTPPTLPSSPKDGDNGDEEEKMETAEEKSSTDEKKDSDEAASEASTVVQEDGEEGGAAEGRGRPQPFENPLLVHLFSHCRLVERVVDAWEENEEEERRSGRRKGYMGHLTRVANCLQGHAAAEGAPSGPGDAQSAHAQMASLPESVRRGWERLAKGGLQETNERNVIVPASSYNNAMSSSEDDDADFRDMHFPQENALQQMFSDYQMQQMSENFIDSFGFGAEDFGDSDDAGGMKRLTTVNFGYDDDDAEDGSGSGGSPSSSGSKDKAAAMFESVCEERISGSGGGRGSDGEEEEDDKDADDDVWGDKTREISFGEAVASSSTPGGGKKEEEDKDMEVDEDDDWPSADRKPQSSAPVAMDTGNPWDSSSSGGGGGSGAEPGAVQDPPTSSASSAAAHAQNAPPTSKADEEQLVRSSTPPEDGWANFGEFESSAAAVSSSSSGEKNDS